MNHESLSTGEIYNLHNKHGSEADLGGRSGGSLSPSPLPITSLGVLVTCPTKKNSTLRKLHFATQLVDCYCNLWGRGRGEGGVSVG